MDDLLPPSSSYLSWVSAVASRHRATLTVVMVYLVWCRSTTSLLARTKPWGPRWLAVVVARFLSWLLSAVNGNSIQVKPPPEPLVVGKQYEVVWHPHGVFTTMAFMYCGLHTVTASPLSWYPGVSPLLFRLPIFREVLLLLNARSVNGRCLDRLAAAGCNIGVQPGGIPEQIISDSSREVALFPGRLGFIKLAMRHGAELLPAYIFGENQAYDTCGSVGRAISKFSFHWFGFPILLVRGRWGLPWIVPKAVDVHVCWGRPVPVGPPDASPTEDQVLAVFTKYVAELRRLFDENKDKCLPPEVAKHGLSIGTWGHEARGCVSLDKLRSCL
mmetsp:Transcript_521/g.962  ORF Transcript_521/g.962 Transcript_521/m.962 type:complete len:329 (+) Transcript_521:360-1346(+)|eukprot:CAMPEP_0119308072 /NCGR_PEP_ID=MMETSP1333-20130426/8389_1 /TAXON_ID=418940 /ORGANISM="Scyphosphaera apsteinii, Strain RCC1455" /LENGTH=328 /DNA_ID=CAMNT_0007311765 /DNA_START=356 /DNA_END=1342 /DNA_ORIENTATION=-